MSNIQVATVEVDGAGVFYRSAGPQEGMVVLLLHGFPSSSYQYTYMIPLLASAGYRVLAPDLPGFGFTSVPENYNYTFDNLTSTIDSFLSTLQVEKFAVYIFDYGAPTGLRLALKRPDDILAIVSQNGNAYDEGFGEDFWAPLRKYWETGDTRDREVLRAALSLEAVKSQYTDGEPHPDQAPPEFFYLDYYLMTRPGNDNAQLDLFYDYRRNLDLYPRFQEYFRETQVPLLAAWGKNDTIFVKAGALAFKKDLPKAEVALLDAGHFASVTKTREIVALMLKFFQRNGI